MTMILLAIHQTEFWAFSALFVFGFGFMNGLTYMVPVHHGWLWFPERSGLVSGIIIGGFGLGPLIFNNVSLAVINPLNESSDENGKFTDEINERFIGMMITANCWNHLFAWAPNLKPIGSSFKNQSLNHLKLLKNQTKS